MNLFVSNIDFKIDENELKSILEKFGKVKSLKILTDPDSAKGFVKMGSEYEGQKAIIRLNNKLFRKRKLSVQEARPKPPKINPNAKVEENDSTTKNTKMTRKRKRKRLIVEGDF